MLVISIVSVVVIVMFLMCISCTGYVSVSVNYLLFYFTMLYYFLCKILLDVFYIIFNVSSVLACVKCRVCFCSDVTVLSKFIFYICFTYLSLLLVLVCSVNTITICVILSYLLVFCIFILTC